MTLSQCVKRLRSRFLVDMDADDDEDTTRLLDDDNAAAAAIAVAAKKVSREAYLLATWRAGLTLTEGIGEYNLLDPAVCSLPVFHVDKVHLNASWLTEYRPQEFFENNPRYFDDPSGPSPYCWSNLAPSKIIINTPPNAACVAASDNFLTGFYEHPVYGKPDQWDTEMLGPDVFHEQYVNRAFLDMSKSFVSGQEGYTRRNTVRAEHEAAILAEKNHNLAMYRKIKRKAGIGMTRRVSSFGCR